MKINLLALFGAIIFFSNGVIAPLPYKYTYCCMRCGINHVMCKYPRPGPGPACEEFIRSGLSEDDKKVVLDVHNELRNHVASGKVRLFPATGANMKELEWDDELELFAKRLAEQCIPVTERVCSDSIRFRVGQNFGMAQNIDQQNLRSVEEHVRMWFRSHKHCVVKSILSNDPNQPTYIKPTFCNDYETTYDFTQLTWGNSYKLGCSYSEFKTTNEIEKVKYAKNILICNYAPSGNVKGEDPFVVGEPCSACSNGTTCSERYPSLCTGNAVRIYPNRKYLFTMASISLVLITLRDFI